LGGETSATIVRNTITKNRVGIFSYGAIANISLNVIEGNTGPGIGSSFGSSSLTITGNTIRRNGEEGIDIHGYDVAILLQNTVVENQGDGISLVVKFAQVAGNRILANGGNGISVWSPWFEDAIGVIVGTHEIPSYVHANEIRDNKGYGLFAKDASLILMCYGDKISGNGLGDFSENLKDKCKKAEEWE
jgi:parallel beta-helix repeat protein